MGVSGLRSDVGQVDVYVIVPATSGERKYESSEQSEEEWIGNGLAQTGHILAP